MRYIKYGPYIIYKTTPLGFKQEAYNTITGTVYRYDFTKSRFYNAEANNYAELYHPEGEERTIKESILLTLLIMGEITVKELKALPFKVVDNKKNVTSSFLSFLEEHPILHRNSDYSGFPAFYDNPKGDGSFSTCTLDEFYIGVGFNVLFYPDFVIKSLKTGDDITGTLVLDMNSWVPGLADYRQQDHNLTYGTVLKLSGPVDYQEATVFQGETLVEYKQIYYYRSLVEVATSKCLVVPWDVDNITLTYKDGNIHSLELTDGNCRVVYSCKKITLTKQQLHAVAWAELNLYCGHSFDLEPFSEECNSKDKNIINLLNYVKGLETTYFKPYFSKLSIRKEVYVENY